MWAMVLERMGEPLREREVPAPQPGPGQIRIQVRACGICRTDLHIIDGDLPEPDLPRILGHQIVGITDQVGEGVRDLTPGDRVGVPWLGDTCGECQYCLEGRENLCDQARFTGYHIDGGFAEYAVAEARYCFSIPAGFPDLQAAPLLCAGLIGYRSWRIAGMPQRAGFYGFGSAAHTLIQVALYQGSEVFAFTRPGDKEAQAFARSLGAIWAGGSDQEPPEALDGAILFAPVGALVPAALRAVRKGAPVVCAGIHMSDIPRFPYRILWEERSLHSVANLTRQDGTEFFELAPQVPVRTRVTRFELGQANEALTALREGQFQGSGVLVVSPA